MKGKKEAELTPQQGAIAEAIGRNPELFALARRKRLALKAPALSPKEEAVMTAISTSGEFAVEKALATHRGIKRLRPKE